MKQATVRGAVTRRSDEDIARVVHEANAALQYLDGDPLPSTTWDAEPRHIKDLCIRGVRLVRQGGGPRELHEEWCEWKRGLNWQHGAEKDPQCRTHPYLVSYDQLPPERRDGPKLFWAVVLALTIDV